MHAVLSLGKWLLREAVAAIAPVLGGCAAALANQCGNSALGRAVGQGVQNVLEYFGERIVEKWVDALKDEPEEQQRAALTELAAMPPAEVRQETQALLDQLDLQLIDADKQVALDYLTAIPQLLSRTLARTHPAGPTQAADLLLLLPPDLPPYAAPCDLPGTTYRLEALVGMGGFGTVYRAVDAKMPYMPLAIKFRRDAGADPVLRRERDNLERLLRADATSWSPRLVRLCGYDLDHATPFLVYEWVPGGDLASVLMARPVRPAPEEVLTWVRGIVEGLAFAHRHGVIHRDLKPANVLLALDGVKVTDFGIGTAASASPNATRTLLRGAGTPLYMAPEQRRGAPADPRHDLYSVGVIWYQCLLGDCSAEMVPGWEDLLLDSGAPPAHVELIRRCVGAIGKRPADAGELLALLGNPESLAPSEEAPSKLVTLMGKLRQTHEDLLRAATPTVKERVYATLLAVGVWLGVMSVLTTPTAVLLEQLGGMRAMHWMPLVAILSMIASVWIAIRTAKASLRRAVRLRQEPLRRSVDTQISLLANLFPDAVVAWGGPNGLRDGYAVERIAVQLETRAELGSQVRRANWKPPATTAPADAARTAVGLLPELIRHHRLRLDALYEARKPTKADAILTAIVAFYSFGITGGVIIALPVVFIALYGSTLAMAINIPIIAVVGAVISIGVAILAGRWVFFRQQQRRMVKPLAEVVDSVGLLTRAMPAEIEAIGGAGQLYDPDSARAALARLELLLTQSPTS
jgi:hypothetical protein